MAVKLVLNNILRKISSNKFFALLFSVSFDKKGKHKILTILGIKIHFKIRQRINNKDYELYAEYVLNKQLDKSDFVKLSDDFYNASDNDVKLISFYLPQFHDFEENIKWFGKGFSEWSNTSKAVPQFVEHYQPHIPIDVGYYNLDNNSAIKRQIELAKQYGIYGFSFYYYWFSGKKLMEKPLERFLSDKSLDMPFFLFWANHDWTMNWDNGQSKKVLYKQMLNANDEQKFMDDILPYMKDDRYIKIDNKPILVLYNPHIYKYERYISFNNTIRKIAKINGFDDLYIITPTYRADMLKNVTYKEFIDKYNLDALFEFYPMGMRDLKYKQIKFMNKKFKGSNWDMDDFIKNKKYLYPSDVNLYKCTFPSWDNTSRKCFTGADIYQNTPQNYKIWLNDVIKWTKENKRKNEQFVFINAWNEWAEGAHLEPDQKYGYAYLQATKDILEQVNAQF